MKQITIDVPDNYPKIKLKEKIQKLETDLIKEANDFQQSKKIAEDKEIDPWDALDIESIAVDTGRTDGSINHDHYLYGIPKK